MEYDCMYVFVYLYAHVCYYLLKLLDFLIIYLIIDTYIQLCVSNVGTTIYLLGFNNSFSRSYVIQYISSSSSIVTIQLKSYVYFCFYGLSCKNHIFGKQNTKINNPRKVQFQFKLRLYLFAM